MEKNINMKTTEKENLQYNRNEIEKIKEVKNVIMKDDKMIITLYEEFDENFADFEKSIFKLLKIYPVPCDVNINDWIIYFN